MVIKPAESFDLGFPGIHVAQMTHSKQLKPSGDPAKEKIYYTVGGCYYFLNTGIDDS